MEYLNEDGSLDIERINNLQIEERLRVIESFTRTQSDEYWSKTLSTRGRTRAIIVNYSMEDDGVDAFEFLAKMRKKYERS